MRILFLLPDFPYPPSTGGRKKVFSVLQYLSGRHQCDLLCFGEITEACKRGLAEALPHVGILGVTAPCSGIRKWVGTIWHLIRLLPPSLARFSKADYAEAVKDALKSGTYDAVHYDIINMAQYIRIGERLPSVHSPNDATSNVYFRLARSSNGYLTKAKLYISAFLLRRYERNIYGRFTKIHVVSEADREYLEGVNKNLDIEVIPISSGRAHAISLAPTPVAVVRPNDAPPTIVVCGNFGDAAIGRGLSGILEDVYPRLIEIFPSLRLWILGRNMPPDLLGQIRATANTEYFSWVEDFDRFIGEADVVLVPDLAGAPGAKTRVVQAMALGAAVVGTRTAFEGIPATNGTHGVIYDGMEECACALKGLLEDGAMRRKLGLAATALAADEYSLDRVGPRYESLYLSAVEKHIPQNISHSGQRQAHGPLRVFHFILDHRIGGPHIYVRSLTKALNGAVASTVVTTGRGELTDISLTNLRHRLRMLYPVEVFCNVLRLLWFFRNAAARRHCMFDVHGAANLAPIIAARLLGMPVVWHFHEALGGMKGLVRLGKLAIAGIPYRMVAVAKRSMEAYRINDAELILAPLDTSYWQVANCQRNARGQNAVLRLVSVGNLNPLKGMDILLDAVAALDMPLELVIVGAELSTFREYAASLHEKGRIAEQGLGKVQFVGWQSTESVRELLAKANVFVLSSRSEAGPIALFEAMAMECACVITDVGDVREIMGDADAGIVVKCEDPMALSAALKQVHALGTTGRRSMGVRARKRVINNCSPEKVAMRHLQIYTELSQRE